MYNSDDSDNSFSIATLYHFCVLRKNVGKRKWRRFTAHELCKERPREGNYVKLFRSLSTGWDDKKLFEDMRISKATFQYILQHMKLYDANRWYYNCHGRPIMYEDS